MSNNTERKRVTVVGGGVVGTCCAYFLQRAGHSVTLVDRGGFGQGTSWGNAGIIADYERIPFNNFGFVRQVPHMLAINDGCVSFVYTKHLLTTSLAFCLRFLRCCTPSVSAHSADVMTALHNQAGPAWDEVLTEFPASKVSSMMGSQIIQVADKSHWPGLKSFTLERRERGSELSPSENLTELRSLDPALSVSGNFTSLHGAAVAHGARFFKNPSQLVADISEVIQHRYKGTLLQAEVIDVKEGNVTVRSKDGKVSTIEGDIVVLAVGPFGLELLPRIGEAKAPMDVERGYSIAFRGEGAEGFTSAVGWTPHKFYFTPMEDHLRVAGIVEFGGLGPKNEARLDWLERKARAQVPSLPPRDKASDWVGYRPSLPDAVPVISWSKNNPQALHCYGHGHFGLTQGAITGKLVESMVAGKPLFDTTPFALDRFMTFL